MFKNHLKTAWRNLVKNKFYSSINIAGLTAGLAVGILILLWVQDELSFNRFHQQAGNIYKLENQVGTGASVQIWTETVAPIGMMGKQQLPEIREIVRWCYGGLYYSMTYKDKRLNIERPIMADPAFFSMFSFPVIKGNTTNPFPNVNSIVLTESAAKKYFGNEDPIGKVIVADKTTNFTVTGITKDVPKNSSIQYDIVMPLQLYAQLQYKDRKDMTFDNDFHQFNFDTYLLLQPGTDLNKLATQLRNIHLRNKADDTDIKYQFLHLPDMHLYQSDGKEAGMETVRMFTWIALIILIIACINYVNLSTARSMLRAKEVSMRKIVGAAKWQLFLQFIVETALLFILAAILAIGVIKLLLPFFNQLSGKTLQLNLGDYHLWFLFLITIIGSLIISSIYPALLLSSFEPLKALKGKMNARISDALFRKALVVTQFACSVALIIGTLIIGRQLDYIRTRNLGYDKDHVLGVWVRDGGTHYNAIRTALLSQPGVLDVTRANGNIINLTNQTGNNWWDGKGANETMMMCPVAISENFIPFFKMQLVAGANFTGTPSDSAHFILNETAIRQAGIKDPIGKRFKLWETAGTITGVVKDFHFASMKSKIEPAIFYIHKAQNASLYIKTTARDASKAIAAAEKITKQYNGEVPFEYTFLDDAFDRLYKTETRTGTIFSIFAAIAIVICCLGLLGLATYTAQVRTREIGIRKVLGASVAGIIRLLARDFITLVLISIVIATPIAWYAMNKWLQDFAYKINIGWTVFVLAGIIAILIAIITISFQSVKAALANPVKTLRSE
ncbi:FtsX-like permease family protein [Pseudoflavitalea sp. X16]|uniref:ABC transporter permease n=1 Tax=Paraflavitalea devenefica TaxID=2716334 RepID=UPI00141F3FFC|nr:ABC transporter permease [Paraflavitalea devenefica]NII25788.1 FtsX-like permease family protein [Paraflavitalea devenefica]